MQGTGAMHPVKIYWEKSPEIRHVQISGSVKKPRVIFGKNIIAAENDIK